MKKLRKVVQSGVAFIALAALLSIQIPLPVAQAAALTSVKDTLSSNQSNTVANHTLTFVTPTGVESSTDTITIDFTDFTIGSVDFTDIDLAVDGDANCDGAWTDKTLAASAAAATWGAAIASSVLTLTPPTDAGAGEITAGRCVQVEVGLNATAGVAGNAQFTNPNDQNTHVIEIAGVFGDSKSYALDFVADESVNITANVDPSISFSITDTAIGFGTLTTGTERYATADATGTATLPGTTAGAFDLSIATNAASGYAITYNGSTLTSGGNTVDPLTAGITNDPNGTPGTEQFGMSIDDNAATVTIASGYDYDTSADWKFVADTTTTLASETDSAPTTTIDVFFLANIAATTEAGAYATNITYIATGTF